MEGPLKKKQIYAGVPSVSPWLLSARQIGSVTFPGPRRTYFGSADTGTALQLINMEKRIKRDL